MEEEETLESTISKVERTILQLVKRRNKTLDMLNSGDLGGDQISVVRSNLAILEAELAEGASQLRQLKTTLQEKQGNESVTGTSNVTIGDVNSNTAGRTESEGSGFDQVNESLEKADLNNQIRDHIANIKQLKEDKDKIESELKDSEGRYTDELRKEIDDDKPLNRLKKILMGVSLVLLVFSVANVSVSEASILGLKLKLSSVERLSPMLLISVVALLLWYHQSLSVYRNRLYILWTKAMMLDPSIFNYCPYTDSLSGVLWDIAPQEYRGEDVPAAYQLETVQFERGKVGNRVIYRWEDEYRGNCGEYKPSEATIWHWRSKKIGIWVKIRVTGYQLKYSLNRENTELILIPYTLATLAVFSAFILRM